ncbi:MAG: hypothetical protein FJ395_06180 [Verrucomicrobia bacterium]|nr:hypothetical protein [Verrucomicrobiota bacterium]
MLTLERCREILGKECTLSDSELELLRDQLYGLADVAVEAFVDQRQRRGKASPVAYKPEIRAIDGGDGLGHGQDPVAFQDAAALLSPDDRAEIEERAAIMELDGGLDRDRAERYSFSDLWRRKHKTQR